METLDDGEGSLKKTYKPRPMDYRKSGYHIIYKATSPDGKFYIGYTSWKLKERIWAHHGDANKGSSFHFHRALVKHNFKFKWEILATYQNKKYALNREQYFIQKYDAINLGYNIHKGGQGGPTTNPSRNTPIIDKDGKIYSSFKEAAEILGLPYQLIPGSIQRKGFCGDNYFSRYIEGMTKAEPPSPRKPIKHNKQFQKGVIAHNIRKVIDDRGRIYDSVQAAASAVNGSSGSLCKAIKKCVPFKTISFCYYDGSLVACPKFKNKKKVNTCPF